jgi:hypothetical protein
MFGEGRRQGLCPIRLARRSGFDNLGVRWMFVQGLFCAGQNARPMTQKARRSLVRLIITNHDVENSIPVLPFTVRNIGLRREAGCESASGT